MRSERELLNQQITQARILLAKAAGALGSVREEYTTAGELADAIDDFLGLPRMSARVAAIIAKIEVRPRLETTAELMSRVVDGVSVATSPRMVANAKRFNTPHAVEHDWTIACHAPPKCKRLEIPIEDEETGADSPKWLPWKLSPDSDPAERWILVSAENDEIEHPANEKYDTEAQAWIACERESK